MNREVLKICEAVREAGGRAMLVGGSVRDWLFGIQPKDFDIEVFGLDPVKLRELLEPIARVSTVGEHFAVYKLFFYRAAEDRQRFEIDVSLPRRESKSGRGHRGFLIEGDPTMTFEEAARRRDFTINAILMDPLIEKVVDPFGGVADIRRRILKAIAPETFVEDSLRVLRAVQLAARFEMAVEPQTAELCRSIDLTDLPRERIWGEVEKLLMLAERPSIGLDVALQLGVLDNLFPEIRSLVGRDDGSDSFTVTKLSLDAASRLSRDLPRERRLAVMLAVLCHKLGGVETPPIKKERGRESMSQTESVLDRLGIHTLGGSDVRSRVLELVREQDTPKRFYRDREHTTDGDFRRLSRRVEISLLHVAGKAFSAGRGSESLASHEWFITRARSLGVEHGPPPPLLKGRHLIEIGLDPGPRMGDLLRRVYERQLDGEVTSLDEALAAARRMS